ncbi:MAG: PKD domain-containing protein [Bacteroidota bacterium]
MRNLLLLTLVVLTSCFTSFSQQHSCASADVTTIKRTSDANYDLQLQLAEQQLRDFVSSGQANVANPSRAVRTIPVVFHVVYNTAAQNVSTTIIQQTLAQLNKDYRKLNTDLAQARSVVQPFAADAQIEFCLAQQTPTGQSTTGIERVSTSKTCWDVDTETDKMKSTSTGGANSWDATRYLNIWIVRLCGNSCQTGGTGGYAYLPTQGMHGSSIDGVVLDYCLGVGTGNMALTHEIGHYLGLHHTWGDLSSNACGNIFPGTDDGFSDTPDSKQPNYGCTPVVSCTNNSSYGDLLEDFMDYSSCSVLFTTQQSSYMNNILTTTRGSLLNSNVCSSTGAPLANFTANPTSICPSQTVTFTNSSTGSGNTYSWSFPGGTPSTSTVTSPTITYNTPGTYSATLTATNNIGSNISTQTNIISVAGNTPLPLSEGFESSTFPPAGWLLTNADAATTWVRTTSASGFGTSSACAYINDYSYTTIGQTDWLITPAYNFTSVNAGRIRWEYAYAPYAASGYADSLEVLYSTNCGVSWTSLWKKGGTALGTATATYNNFTATSSQWKRDSVSLASLSGQSLVRFAFKSANKNGNNIFLDNINIYNSVSVPQAPVANFIGTPTTVVAGSTVVFTDISPNSPTSWSWTFAGGTPGTSTQQNPTITYNTPGTYNVTLTATNATGNNTATKTGYITVIQAGGQVCDTLANITALDTLVLYALPSGLGTGYLSGNNAFGDLAKAERYTNAQSRQVTGAFYLFGRATVSGSGTIQACVWDASGVGGSPGAAPLVSVAVNISTIMTDISLQRFTYVSFPSPPTVTGNFYVGFILPTGAGDTVAIATTSRYSPSVGQGWEQYSDGEWHVYGDYWWQYFAGFEVSNIVYPVLCVGGGGGPTASFTANDQTVCAGTTVTFTSTSTGSPTSYSWIFAGGTPGVSTAQNPTVTYNTAGIYNVSLNVSNSNGNNTSTQTGYITVYPKPVLATTTNPVLCFGGSTGSATVTPTGGTPAYTYTWSGGGSSASITNKPSATYTVSVADSRQCSATASANIGQPTSALTLQPNASDAICNQPNGSVSVTANGGAGGYTYLWNNNATTATVSNVGPGSYSVIVNDANSCTASASMTVSTSTSNFSVSISVENATCGVANGTAVALPNNGNFGITYVWNTSANSGSISSLAAGTYSVTVTNNAGCTASATATLTGSGTAINITFSVTPAGCGQSNGAVASTATGGSGSYTYSWSNTLTTSSIASLPAGSYSVTISDNAGCSAADNAMVTNMGAPTVTFTAQDPTSGASNGSITATTTGGSAPYTYLWSNGETTATILNLPSGTYIVTITDSQGCIVTSGATILAPTGIEPTDAAAFVKVFPNPARDVFNIQIELENTQPLDLEILNQLGQVVWKKHFVAYHLGTETVDVSKLSAGVYYLKANTTAIRFVKE